MFHSTIHSILRPTTLPLIWLVVLSTLATAQDKASDAPIHERIEWTEIRINNTNDDDLPRVLLIGDSITRGYFGQVEKRLKGRANLARYTTSAFAGHADFRSGLRILLRRYRFDVVHVNNGLHGWGYSEQQYEQAIRELASFLKQESRGATLIWATTTPTRAMRTPQRPFSERITRIRRRNEIALEIVKHAGWLVSDLYTLSADHPSHLGADGIHFSSEGTAKQGQYIAELIGTALDERKR